MNQNPVTLPSQSLDPSSAMLDGVGRACVRALVSQCHPRMLFALLLPFLIMFVGGSLLLWLAWTPLTQALQNGLDGVGVVNRVDQWMVMAGLFSLKVWLIPLLAVVILLPMAGILGLVVAAIWVMPLVLSHVASREYPELSRQGRHAWVGSIWNTLWVMCIFIIGWMLTLPLWLIPPLGVLLSVFWWAFAFTRIMRVDALIEHASPQERKLLQQRCYGGFWSLGLICALLQLLPPAWLFLPVFSALLFVHYGLDRLRRLRAESIIDV
ncbi:hypothetical protein DD235_02825 [Corticimicrobacter populi]|uniref:EI24 domain-containing protein n=2 Tax=Corticimicrobacter populi TaxID=2175229 RepID=A0A2V1K4E4_9BURK|nr:hypothetical protein DD235_02825 [Corticimicrobacter populi]